MIVWYDRNDEFAGFQLCYDIRNEERALTWKKESRWSHDKIDAGEVSGRSKMTPILVADGIFPQDEIASLFKEASREIEPALAGLIYKKIKDYPR